MITLKHLQDVLLQCIAALLCDYDVVQLRFCCRQLHRATKNHTALSRNMESSQYSTSRHHGSSEISFGE